MSVELMVWGGLLALSGLGLIRLLAQVRMPALWVWFIAGGLVTLYALLSVLFEVGGRFLVLFPVFFPLKVTVQTTGALALAIACYSSIEGPDKISPQWFAIPTGSAPLSMIYEYVAPWHIQAAVLGAAIAYSASKGSKFTVPLLAAVGSIAVDYYGVSLAGILDQTQLFFALNAAAILMCSEIVTGGGGSGGSKRKRG